MKVQEEFVKYAIEKEMRELGTAIFGLRTQTDYYHL
jgi:hypothetical protein